MAFRAYGHFGHATVPGLKTLILLPNNTSMKFSILIETTHF